MFRLFIITLLAFTGLKTLAVDGDFSGQYRFRTGVGVNSSTGFGDLLTKDVDLKGMDIRASISGSFRPSESFEANSTLFFSGLDGGSVINRVTPMAYGDWMISDELMLRVGRSTYKIADGSVIGLNDYQAVPLYFNGLFLTHSSDSFGIDLIAANAYLESVSLNPASVQQGMEKAPPGIALPTAAIISLDARSFPELIKTANLHFIVPVKDYNKARAGASIGGGAMGFGYRATAAVSSLTSIGMSELMLDGKLSYTFEMDSSALRFYVGGHMDGENYDALLYDIHRKAGKMDAAVWGKGLQYAKGGLSYWMDSDFGVGLKGYYFLKPGANNPSLDANSMEFDLYVKKVFDSTVSGKAWVGLLKESSETHAHAQFTAQMKF